MRWTEVISLTLTSCHTDNT